MSNTLNFSWGLIKASDVNNIYAYILSRLQKDVKMTAISKQFSDLQTNADRVSFVHKIMEEYDKFPALVTDMKSDERAFEFRQQGNFFYKNKNISHALKMYTSCIANATGDNEELALAYGNRSAALFEMGFYNECLEDIERALKCNYPDNSKQKLLNRQNKAKKLQTKQCKPSYYDEIPVIPQELKNPSIQSATNSVEIKYSQEFGRHVVATKDIEIGEVIAVEKSYCTVLAQDFTCHCYECLELCYNPLPCPNCTQALFCSRDCQIKAQKYHDYSCRILKTIRELNLDKMRLLAVKIAMFTSKNEFANLKSDLTLKEGETYYSDRYKEIHNFVSHTDQREVGDLFKKATQAAIVFDIVKKFTTYLENEEEEYAFKEILLLHMQTVPCNLHAITEVRDAYENIEYKQVGAGVFSFLSLFNHSCNQNVFRTCYGTTTVLRACVRIRKGEQCFDNYGYDYGITPKEIRRNNLEEQYYFNCSCDACVNDWPCRNPIPAFDVIIGFEYWAKLLKNGDRDCAKKVLKMILPRMNEFKVVKQNETFLLMKEILKACFDLLGSCQLSQS